MLCITPHDHVRLVKSFLKGVKKILTEIIKKEAFMMSVPDMHHQSDYE